MNHLQFLMLFVNQQPADCRILIEKLKSCSDDQLLVELQHIKTWNIGKVRLEEQASNRFVFQPVILEEALLTRTAAEYVNSPLSLLSFSHLSHCKLYHLDSALLARNQVF